MWGIFLRRRNWWRIRIEWVEINLKRYTCFRSGEMNDEVQDLLAAGYKPVLVGPQPFSFEDILRNVDPAPDKETDRFIAAIYGDRRLATEKSSLE